MIFINPAPVATLIATDAYWIALNLPSKPTQRVDVV